MVALSTSEAEYMALSSAVQEALWLQNLFTDLRMTAKPITIKEHNQGAIALTQNPITHSRTKHIDIHFHFIREAREDGSIVIIYCPTSEMIADLFTKPIPRCQFEKLHDLLGMKEFLN